MGGADAMIVLIEGAGSVNAVPHIYARYRGRAYLVMFHINPLSDRPVNLTDITFVAQFC